MCKRSVCDERLEALLPHHRKLRNPRSNSLGSGVRSLDVKNPRDQGRAKKISLPWDLRDGDGFGGGGIARTRVERDRLGRKYLSTDVDLSRKERRRAPGRLSR